MKKGYERFKEIAPQYLGLFEIEDKAKKARALTVFDREMKAIKDELRKDKDKTKLYEVLTWELHRKRLPDFSDEWHELNEIEAKKCTMKCEQHRRIQSGRHSHFDVGMIYPCSMIFEPGTARNVYTIFHIKIRTSQEQMKAGVKDKLMMGIAPTQDDYLPPKELMDRLVLSEKEFNNYFRILKDETIEDVQSENLIA